MIWRKSALGALLVMFSLLVFSTHTPAQASATFTAKYELVITKPETHILHVNATFAHPPQILRLRILEPGTLTYQIGMSPDETITYPFHVANIEVLDDKGREMPFTWTPRPGQPSYLTITTGGKSPIHLSYDVAVLRASGVRIGWEHVRAEAYLGPEYGLIVPDATLFLPLRLPTVTLRFRLPNHWRPVVDGEETAPGEYVMDITPIQHNECICGALSFIGVGPLQVFHKQISGKDLIIAIEQGKQIPVGQMLDLASRSFTYYSRRFGPYPNGDRFLIFFFKDVSSGGCFHGFLFSFREGNSNAHNYLGSPHPDCYPTWYMHVPDAMIYTWMDGLGVFSKNPHTDATWLIQSMSVTFYRLSVQLGYASEAEYYSRLLSDWQVYQSDLKSAGTTNDRIVLAHTDSPLIVGKSGIVTSILREDIVRDTHGEKDFDDLLSMVVVPNPRGFTNADILKALKELTGKDYTDFFQKYIYGTADLPMDWVEKKYQEVLAHGEKYAHPDPRPGLQGWKISWLQSKITEDGNTSDWAALASPMVTVNGVPIYAFADENYLYLRLDHYRSVGDQKFILSLFSPAHHNLVGIFLDPSEPYYVAVQHGGKETRVIPVAEQEGDVLEVVIPKEYLGALDHFQMRSRLSSSAKWNQFGAEIVHPTPTPTPTLTPTLTPTPTATIPSTSTPTFTSFPSPSLTPTRSRATANSHGTPWIYYGVLFLLLIAGWFTGRWLRRK